MSWTFADGLRIVSLTNNSKTPPGFYDICAKQLRVYELLWKLVAFASVLLVCCLLSIQTNEKKLIIRSRLERPRCRNNVIWNVLRSTTATGFTQASHNKDLMQAWDDGSKVWSSSYCQVISHPVALTFCRQVVLNRSYCLQSHRGILFWIIQVFKDISLSVPAQRSIMQFIPFLLASFLLIDSILTEDAEPFLPNTVCRDYARQKSNKQSSENPKPYRRTKTCCMPNDSPAVKHMQRATGAPPTPPGSYYLCIQCMFSPSPLLSTCWSLSTPPFERNRWKIAHRFV